MCVFIVKKRPKLKNRYKTRVQATTKYAKTIDNFDNLVDPRCERPRKKKRPSKKRFEYLLGHLFFWISGMELPLNFLLKK